MAVPDIPTTIRVENIHRVHDPFQPNYTETSAMQGIAGTETVVYCYNISKQTMQHADMMTLASTVTDPGGVSPDITKKEENKKWYNNKLY